MANVDDVPLMELGAALEFAGCQPCPLTEFLNTVPGSSKKGRVASVVTLLTDAKNEIESVEDMYNVEFSRLNGLEHVSPGLRGFIENAFNVAHKRNPDRPVVEQPPQQICDPLKAMSAAFAKEQKEREDLTKHIDLGAQLKKMDLNGLSRLCWPAGHLVDSLASDAAKLKRKNIAKPFVYVEVSKFLPDWCSGMNTCVEPEPETKSPAVEELARLILKDTAPPKQKKSLNMLQWQVAFDGLAVAAAAAGQWKFVSAMGHKQVCLKVAAGADREKGRKWSLAILYDQLCRKSWAERAYTGDDSLDVDRECSVLDVSVLQAAKDLYDQNTFSENSQKGGRGSGNGKGFGKGSSGKSQQAPWSKRPAANSWESSSSKRREH